MPRSADALKRRAEKRNISENAMRKIDAQPTKKVRSTGVTPPGLMRRTSTNETLKKWTCKVCTNVNLAHMCPKKCNNCQRARVEVDDEYEFTGTCSIIPAQLIDKRPDSSSHWLCMKCNNKNLTMFFPKTCNRCQRERSIEGDVETSSESATGRSSERGSTPVATITKAVMDKPKSTSEKQLADVASTERVSGKKRDRDAGPACVAVAVAAPGGTEADTVAASTFWTCSVCNNRNIRAVHTLTCNRCQRHRKEVEVKEGAGASAPSSATQSRQRVAASAPISSTTAVAAAAPAPAPVSSTHWCCSVCNNRNISALHKLTCNRCQRSRSEKVESKTIVAAPPAQTTDVAAVTDAVKRREPTSASRPAPEVWMCAKCKNKNPVSLSLSVCNRCQRPKPDVGALAPPGGSAALSSAAVAEKQGNSWDAAVADKALIEKNMRLRAEFLDAGRCADMSEEDRVRAQVLVERSKRKAEKKDRRNAWKKKIKKR